MADYGSSRAGTGSNASGPNAEEILRPLVTCGICMELYIDPVALLDCLHLACGACAKDWLERSPIPTCHQCRGHVRGTRDSHHATAMVEAYQTIAPNSNISQGRTAEEIAALRLRYRPGQGAAAGVDPGRNQASRLSAPVSTDSDVSPDTDFEMPPPLSPPNFPRYDDSCLFCDSSNQSGFVCPQPYTRPPTNAGRHTIPLGHTTCATCLRLVPLRPLPGSKCVVCTRTACSQLGQRCRNSPTNHRDLELLALRAVEFPPRTNLPLNYAFGNNSFERDVFSSYASRRHLSMQQLFREVLAFCGSSMPRATWQGRAFAPFNPIAVNLEDKVCLGCASDLVEANLFDWWLSKRSDADLTAEIMNRQDCPYGIECRTVGAHQRHARTMNHICLPTMDARRQGDSREVPENGNRYVANSPALSHASLVFSRSDIIFRDKGKEAVFACSSICSVEGQTSKIPGKLTIWSPLSVTVYYGLSGRERTHDGSVEILIDTRNMSWVTTSMGVIPPERRPVVGGSLTRDGTSQQLYHCAVWWHGQRIPGYTSPQLGHAVITWDQSEWYIEDQYELLCWN